MPEGTVAEVLELRDTMYHDRTAKHFHERLVDGFGFGCSHNWLRVKLQDARGLQGQHGAREDRATRGALLVPREKRP